MSVNISEKNTGMEAYAILNLSRIDLALKAGIRGDRRRVFLGRVYLPEKLLPERLVRGGCLGIPPKARYDRLAHRTVRPLTAEEAAGRDDAEIRKINKSGPIAMADYTINNEATLKDLKKEVKKAIAFLEERY